MFGLASGQLHLTITTSVNQTWTGTNMIYGLERTQSVTECQAEEFSQRTSHNHIHRLVLHLQRAATAPWTGYRKMQLFHLPPLSVCPLALLCFYSQHLSLLAMTHLATFLPVLLQELVLLEGRRFPLFAEVPSV